MSQSDSVMADFHWIVDTLQFIDVGLVILDERYNICLWNSFMQNHSAKSADEVMGKQLFDLFPELPENWFRRKANSVFSLNNSAFTTWEQRPYLFRFEGYRPITSMAEYMYQNSTIIPLKNANGQVNHICLIVYDVTEVAVNRIQIQAANTKLKHLSRTDGLTGLLNRKSWEGELSKEYARHIRHRHPSSLIMLDIDHFKKVNDTYGHPAGDTVIRETASVIQKSLREIDLAGRYGGEEFAIILPDTNADGALCVAERVRHAIENTTVTHAEHSLSFTISLGIAEIKAEMTDKVQWIELADQGLYQAKESGRNQSFVVR